MELVYADNKVEAVCTSTKAAQRHFGGDKGMAIALMSKIQALEAAPTLQAISLMPSFYLHPLHNKGRSKLQGCFAIDVKGRSNPWRLILQPLDDSHKPLGVTNIDEVASAVKVVMIEQVSKHYE